MNMSDNIENIENTEKNENVDLENEQLEEAIEIEGESADTEIQEAADISDVVSREEFNTLNDKYLRLYAEYENFRKRTAKEKDEIYSSAAADVLANIFPILDVFERALSFSEESNEPEKVLEGLKMIETQFANALIRLGVEEIAAEGEQFNPELHNAVFHETDDSKPNNTVVEVLQKGYSKGDKVLRPAMVRVVN